MKDERSKTQEEVAGALTTVFRIGDSLPSLFRTMCTFVVNSCSSAEHVLAQVCSIMLWKNHLALNFLVGLVAQENYDELLAGYDWPIVLAGVLRKCDY